MTDARILIVGTVDTKSDEIGFLCEQVDRKSTRLNSSH